MRGAAHVQRLTRSDATARALCAARAALRAIRFGAVLENVVVNETTREVDYMSK
jgi:hypothetical protein